jgi:aminopeptidase N
LWTEHDGGATARERFRDVMAIPPDDAFWDLDIADPGRNHLFDNAVYDRGAATLYALRRLVGDDAFFAGARAWLQRYQGGSATTEDFIDVYEDVSGRDLDRFFDRWLRIPAKPVS